MTNSVNLEDYETNNIDTEDADLMVGFSPISIVSGFYEDITSLAQYFVASYYKFGYQWLQRQTYQPATIKVENNPSQDEQSSPMQEKRIRDTISLPWSEGLRP
ncbi:hypothetical protein SUGI_0169390 [Cryptomeria japonica]|nr:hypothetical protein SUGI_0169390 [Cryptomeria japonica]